MFAARVLFGFLLACSGALAAAPDDATLMALLKERVDDRRWATGVVLGITAPTGNRLLSYGTFGIDDVRPVGGDTVFEVASLTKIFTALLLADMAERGKLKIDAPVTTCLGDAKLPSRHGKQITFLDLATHSSGLPLRPTNLASQTGANKYAAYTTTQMFQGLSTYTLERDIGSSFEYSNWGYGLLGHALARCADTSYAALLHQRITGPLRMSDTQIALSAQMKSRMATGHNEQFAPVGPQDMGALVGAAGLFSTANDLLVLIESFVGRNQTALAPAMSRMLTPRRAGDDPSTQMGLGWRITADQDEQIVWSNGRSDGSRAFMGFNPRTRIGVVALANAATNAGVDDIGRHVLDPRQQPLRRHKRIELSASVLERYLGDYRFEDGAQLRIVRDGDLMVSQWRSKQDEDQGASLIHPESERVFNLDDVEAKLVFELPVEGKANAVTLEQNGLSLKAERVK